MKIHLSYNFHLNTERTRFTFEQMLKESNYELNYEYAYNNSTSCHVFSFNFTDIDAFGEVCMLFERCQHIYYLTEEENMKRMEMSVRLSQSELRLLIAEYWYQKTNVERGDDWAESIVKLKEAETELKSLGYDLSELPKPDYLDKPKGGCSGGSCSF